MIPIAHPIADEGTANMVLECTKKQLENGGLISGIKQCQKHILKGESSKALVVLSASTSPMDLITHIPILCEERNIPYLFVENTSYMNGFTCIVLNNGKEECSLVSKIIEWISKRRK
ncbi:uncharacterized protein VICG_01294 [Vittaforma corneae ATCC 50505]|uniref:Ribosomal protein eL8/eL30/eS12/Gadd45 domain-containing protein n=1 Tax=Vittaforma corneae (strain ATCC 50505) TaxID=993615 RepID=L2GLE2_VITCO|nr:uncharacterized protein VICG_01294 [Vittaforma corneae ATCC 50505]ELA41661.1 hypothetical protein VICG_01294 [Vittaforma corneae ATCC 50505]